MVIGPAHVAIKEAKNYFEIFYPHTYFAAHHIDPQIGHQNTGCDILPRSNWQFWTHFHS
jgi:hypothetical protein